MLCPTLVPLDDVATKEGTAWFIPAESESQSNRVERSASWHLMMLIWDAFYIHSYDSYVYLGGIKEDKSMVILSDFPYNKVF